MKQKFYHLAQLIRFFQPTGTFLLILPCLMAITIIYKTQNNIDNKIYFNIIFWFIIGAFLVRSGGCIINDLLDCKFDKKVARTKNRPLASGKISKSLAIKLLMLISGFAFLILLQFNFATITAGFVAVILICCYPLAKRFIKYPQIFLGITFNFGIIMASLALLNSIPLSVVFLFISGIFWTFLYDSIYSFQDLEDDLKINIKSTAVAIHNSKPKNFLIRLALATTLSFSLVGIAEDFNFIYYFLISLIGGFLIYKIIKIDLNNPSQCLVFFKLNNFIGLLFLIAILCG
jgi:4-hydroxybenzoate polyprenyl transferase